VVNIRVASFPDGVIPNASSHVITSSMGFKAWPGYLRSAKKEADQASAAASHWAQT
jgi:hypothetical protein